MLLTTTPTTRFDDEESRTGSLRGITVEEITKRLGFAANRQDDPDKVRHSWGFIAAGQFCAVWDYKGSERAGIFSTFGPRALLAQVFGNHAQD